MEIVRDAQGARSSRHIHQPSQRPLLPILGVSKLETKPPAKTDLKREYLNPKASAANLRQYAANTLPKNPAVADLVQHGEDMKSSLARPLENYFCLGLNLQIFHEYGRRVGMVPRSSLKEGKKRQMVEKGTKTPKTNPKPNTQARRPTPPSCSLPCTLGETCETGTSDN